MKKIKVNLFLSGLILICLVSFTGIASVSAGNSTVRDLKGKVVYQNDMNPVSGGNIEVFLYSDDDDPDKLVEKVSINSAGEFTLTNVNGIQTDRIKIMCYPNDLDNFNTGFQAKEVRLSDAKAGNDKAYDIIIEVKRIDQRDKQD